MLTQETSSQEIFLKHLEDLFLKRSTAKAMTAFQEKAWNHFMELGLPSKKDEAFQYFPLRTFYNEKYGFPQSLPSSFSQYPECKGTTIVFVDGKYSPELSDISKLPKNVVCIPLEEAASTYAAFLQTRYLKYFKEESDPFVFCNLAFNESGLFFYVPPRTIIEEPIHCLHVVTKSENATLVSPRIQLFIGALSEIFWIQTLERGEQKSWINATVDISLEEGSSITFTDLPLANGQSWYTSSIRASVKRDAHFKSTYFTCGSKSVLQRYQVSLLGEQATASIQGLSFLKNNHQAHCNIVMEHIAPHTESMQLIKTVVDDVSQSSFEGKIIVRSDAQKTQAYQLNNNLMLGKHAICNSKPNLEIFADDVKASHGATFAQIDEEQLFYLQTRGIGEEEGKKLLMKGFCLDVLEKIPHEFLKNSIHGLL